MRNDLIDLDGSFDGTRYRMVLVAPRSMEASQWFSVILGGRDVRRGLIDSIQRARGMAYLRDGAVRAIDLTPQGRHVQTVDEASWHLVCLSDGGDVLSCARYHAPINPNFGITGASQTAEYFSPPWRDALVHSIEQTISAASMRNVVFAELGGWYVSDKLRNTSHTLKSVLCMYALGEILGGTLGLSTVTSRHGSASILGRLGGSKLRINNEDLPAYFDPRYGCEMELLRFDSAFPSPRYASVIQALRGIIQRYMPVVCDERSVGSVEPLLALWNEVGESPVSAAEPQILSHGSAGACQHL